MRGEDGTYSINGDELATLITGGEVWWLLPDGSTITTVERTPPEPNALYLMSRSQPWIDQWGGDWQRACDEQLNPALRANAHVLPSEES
ncbi:hypothetical protein [Williamsia sp. D3]|uniref:hypothetical protein n=1 Tax=Williamsia sp. D3 TaxID=1313067 RepID=UPI0003D343E5|nr:hypothetical protein [Williamsia sp. D3]ETD31537.1 hypothetical protein W823_19350 [Williamsia sp. D3]